MHIMQYRSECNGKCLHGCWAHTVLYTTCSISVPKTRHTPLHLLQPASFLLEIQIIFRHKQYLYYESIYIYDVETRHIPLHLLQSCQARFLSAEIQIIFGPKQYIMTVYISVLKTRHIPLHLLQPWQDRVLSGDSDYFWDHECGHKEYIRARAIRLFHT